MNLIYGISQLMHRLRFKLHPNRLPGGKGTYIARNDREAVLDIEQVSVSKKTRGGFTGRLEDMIVYVKLFLDETAYLLSNGYAVNLGYFTIHPKLGGTFASVHETPDPRKHPLTFSMHANAPLIEMAEHIAVEIDTSTDIDVYIKEFRDCELGSVSAYKSGNMFIITGNKIRAAGDDPTVGVYLVPVDNPGAAVKITRILENHHSKITGIVPATGYPKNRVEVRTQYTGATNTPLQAPRTITSSFILEET